MFVVTEVVHVILDCNGIKSRPSRRHKPFAKLFGWKMSSIREGPSKGLKKWTVGDDTAQLLRWLAVVESVKRQLPQPRELFVECCWFLGVSSIIEGG
jgi:hypothetical protein